MLNIIWEIGLNKLFLQLQYYVVGLSSLVHTSESLHIFPAIWNTLFY